MTDTKAKIIVFDVFGTLINSPKNRINPYLRLSKKVGKRLPFLTENKSLAEFAKENDQQYLIPILEHELKTELRQYQLFDDVESIIAKLKSNGKKIGLCSNLAFEYGQLVRDLLPDLDAYIFSYEIGCKKPTAEIYQICCDRLGCRASQILFIGDSEKNDFIAPLSFGMNAKKFDRKSLYQNSV